MQSIREQLSQILVGRVCLIGVGNADYGDDAVGLMLAEQLSQFGGPLRAQICPEEICRSQGGNDGSARHGRAAPSRPTYSEPIPNLF